MKDKIVFRCIAALLGLSGRDTVSLVFGCWITLLLLVTSCSPVDKKDSQTLSYFDLKSFVMKEIGALKARDPEVTKTMYADNKKEIRVSKEIRWDKELELFIQADINKPAYRSSYGVKQSDEFHYQYKLKKGERLPVQSLEITLDSISGKPLLVEAVLLSENKLYRSEKKISLECGQVGSSWMVHSYHVIGYQKLSLMDASNFEVTGFLKYDK